MTNKAQENKELVRHIFTEIGKGNHQPYLDAIAEDITATVTDGIVSSHRAGFQTPF